MHKILLALVAGLAFNITAFATEQPPTIEPDQSDIIATLSGVNLVPATQVKGIPQVQMQDSGIVALLQEASHYYVPLAEVIALPIDNDYPRLDIGPISQQELAASYSGHNAQPVGVTLYQVTGKELKAYMEWAAGYFNQVNEGDVTYSFNPQRRALANSTNDFFSGVTYTINLRQPEGRRIINLKLANGQGISHSTPIKLAMRSDRMAQLTESAGIFADQAFAVLFDSQKEYGQEGGTLIAMTARYLSEVKQRQYQGQSVNRWQLIGLTDYQRERRIVERLINKGLITLPSSSDGRLSNIASINVKDKLVKNKISYQTAIKQREQQWLEAESDSDRKRLADEIVIIREINYF